MTRPALVQPYQTLPKTTAHSPSCSSSSSKSLSNRSHNSSINSTPPSYHLHQLDDCNPSSGNITNSSGSRTTTITSNSFTNNNNNNNSNNNRRISTNVSSLDIAHAYNTTPSAAAPDSFGLKQRRGTTSVEAGTDTRSDPADLDPPKKSNIDRSNTIDSRSESSLGTAAGADEEGTAVHGKTSSLTGYLQDHLKLFFSMHHKLFDLVAFYVVMFAINGQMTSLPTRLEWIGFCVQSIVALRRAFQTSIKHGLGLTSFLGMLDLLVGQLFLHQDRLDLLRTVANILVYFYVINLTRGLVFGDSVSCLLWLLFGLVDIYRKDASSTSNLDLTPYKVIPVHTVGFGLYILMSELVDVMLHSAEPDAAQGRYLNYVGAQKENPVSIRSSRRSSSRSSDPSGLRFELCITEITPFTVSFCLNAVSDVPQSERASEHNPSSAKSPGDQFTQDNSTASGSRHMSDMVDVSSIKIGSIANASSSVTRSQQQHTKTAPNSPRIISTSDIIIHVNYIPWREVQYHFPDDQSFTVYGLTPSTDYEIEMRVHQFSSFVTRIGTRAAPPGTVVPPLIFETPKHVEQSTPKSHKSRRNKKNQKSQKDNLETAEAKSKVSLPDGTTAHSNSSTTSLSKIDTTNTPAPATKPVEDSVATQLKPVKDEKTPNQLLLEELQAQLRSVNEATAGMKAAIKKLKRDQTKSEALLRQELEGIGRGQAKAVVQDQKRRQKVSFVQESIKQTDAQSLVLAKELADLKALSESSQPEVSKVDAAVLETEQNLKTYQASFATELFPLQNECQRLQAELKRLEAEQKEWLAKVGRLQETEMAPLQLRLQRLEQQQVVWHVAAEANRDKDREASAKISTLEEDIKKKAQTSLQLEESIQELKESNVALKSLVEKEIEAWATLEREYDQLEQQQQRQQQKQQQQQQQQQRLQQQQQYPYRSRMEMLTSDPTLQDSNFWLAGRNGTLTSSGWPRPGSALDDHASSSRRKVGGLDSVSGRMWDLPLVAPSKNVPGGGEAKVLKHGGVTEAE
ncbi:hypothetical protein BGZ94_003853 [Podila epigama]|nr:hypothetical protein BGZ94_003853 [Podila epigama]